MKGWIAGLIMNVSLCTAMPAFAEDQPILLQMGTKLTRGVVNLTTGWMEVPKQIYHVGQEEGWVIGVVRGPFDGLGMLAARTLAGAYEILSFPLPIPSRYQPMLLPDYVWQADAPEAPASSFEPIPPVTP
ncbi:MAG: exosortase system-associated protein, TIGR04073 family [Nitrospiraceae bacterium]